ncbi:thiamine pyrophosphate protein domain protein TPP-binding protein [Dehalogenimonas lykanthroporepellens BL-DC-9]|nr:thiamine pyrophosphate protein domain protein TPP-binding protein [Dehalogenimonas lykanthroporepellens BL-DC-9]
MQNLSIYASRLVDKAEPFAPGHRACIGCGEALAVRLAAKAFGPNTIVVNATGCMEIVASQLPYTSWELPWIHTLFENAAAVASGVEVGLKAQMRKGKIPQEDINVVAIAGDGGTFDIGLQALSGALERGHNFLYICFDNEAYMNTGKQRSSATPFGASTTTSPAGKAQSGQTSWKKNMPEIAVAHNIPYVATASHSYPFDLIEKVKKGLSVKGPAYIQVYSACPTGWRCDTDISVKLGRLAVETGAYPLYEVENGKYKMSLVPEKLKPLSEYTSLQRRFRHLKPDEITGIEARLVEEFNRLVEKAKCL